MFAVVHAVLIRPLPVLNQDRLVFVTKRPRNDRQVLPLSYAEHLAMSRLSGIVEASGGSQYDAPLPYRFRAGNQAFNVNVTSVTAGFFAVLGSRAELGKLTVAADQLEPAVIISRRLWQTRFGGDSAVVGRSVRLGDSFDATIIGVAPARFDFPHRSDAWYLVRPPAGKEADYAWFSGVVRLAPGTSLERVRAAVQLIVSRESTQGLMIVEVRPRVVRLLTIEAGLLAAGAAVLGAVVTGVVLRALAVLTPAEVARVSDVQASPALLAALSLAATAAILLFGALPAVWLSRRPPFGALRSAHAGTDALGRSGRIRETLVAVQVALGVIVAVMNRNFLRATPGQRWAERGERANHDAPRDGQHDAPLCSAEGSRGECRRAGSRAPRGEDGIGGESRSHSLSHSQVSRAQERFGKLLCSNVGPLAQPG